MGLFTRDRRIIDANRDATPEQIARYLESKRAAGHAHDMPRVLRASGIKIKPMAAEKMRAIAGNRQQWQSLAWGYRDLIGELRFSLQFRANNIARAKFYVAQINPDDDEPLPLSMRDDKDKDGNPTERSQQITLPPDLCEAAEQELARLPLDTGYGFLGVMCENFDVAGECWLHGRVDPETGEEVWQVRSVDDVDVQGSNITLRDETGQPRRVDLGTEERDGTEELYRLWRPHPRRTYLADSNLNALMDVLEDITLIGRELRAAARSRIASNGVWMIPDTMEMMKNVIADSDAPQDRNTFVVDLTAAMLAPISNEGDAGAVMPILVTGSKEDIEVASKSFIRFEREDSPTLLNKLEKALGRLAASLDIPPEILTGLAGVNHWTAWQIDNATFRNFLEPSIRLLADALTSAFLRVALASQGRWSPEEINQVRIWYDAGQITENPNRRQDAIDAFDRAGISGEAFRSALGFNDGDAPTPEEVYAMIAARQGMDQGTAAAFLSWIIGQSGGEVPPAPATGATGTPRLAPGQVQRPAAEPGPPPAAIAASAERLPVIIAAAENSTPYRLDTETGRRLMELDRGLRVQLLTAADAALARALEKSGNRLRAKATKDPAIAASLKDQPTTVWAAALGKEQTLALGADTAFLLREAWDDLQGKFTRWVGATVEDVITRVLSLLKLDSDSRRGRAVADRMRADMNARMDPAWSRLESSLNEHAEKLLFGVDDEADLGELPESLIPPHLIRTALAEVGGLPETSGGIDTTGRPTLGEPLGSLATGSTVSGVLEEAGVLTVGYLWVYGVTPLKRQFEPHRDLEGERFTDWHDTKLHTDARYAWLGDHYRPGDHRGCMCDYVPGYAVPEYADAVREALGRPTAPTQDILNLAESDDRAGRKGTTAQAVRDQYEAVQALQARFLKGS